MRDLNGNNYGTINDNSQTVIINGIEKYKHTEVEREEISLQTIIKEKVVEAIVGGVLSAIATVINQCEVKDVFVAWENSVVLVLLLLMIVFYIWGIGLLVLAALDAVKIFSLSKVGSFVELEAKIEWIYKLLNFFRTNGETGQEESRTTGKCYKNIDGKIYRIKRKKCPLCETEPIGNMYLEYSNMKKTYYWKCSQNQAHRVVFDYKKKI